jgi:pimeloyl-ACP methyl ester carboxylesterase
MSQRKRTKSSPLRGISARGHAGRVTALSALGSLLIPLVAPTTAEATTVQGATCAHLADEALATHGVSSATAKLVPATSQLPASCQVDLVPERAINVHVALPLNPADGGAGGARSGAWNGRVLNLGGGGYAGYVPDASMALARGEVGSSTDTGHNAAWCNATNPRSGLANAQPDCGLAGGGFVLAPTEKLIKWQVDDFIQRSLYDQTTWALQLTKSYYGRPAQRNYWVGASTGGRQGWEMAQQYPNLFDGFLVGYPAMNWNRFIIGEAWPAVVVNELLGPDGLAPAKSDAANAAAIAACDGGDGTKDGIIAEPRRCHFDARQVKGLSAAEAKAIDLIWDGPRNSAGGRLWGGVNRGTSFDTLLPGGNTMSPMIETYVRYWLYQDAAFDWRKKLTMENFEKAFERSYQKFRHSAATDSTNLSALRRNGAKVIFYDGTNDPLIVPFNSYNYQQRLFDRYGVKATRSFVRTFFFPGMGHNDPTLAGSGTAQDQLLDALQSWVERGRAPESFAQVAGPGQTRTICAYPDRAVTAGNAASCKSQSKVPSDLAAASRTVKEQ